MLTHTGRKSGAKRQTVVEVVDHDPASGTYFIASGWGEKSDWLQNVMKTPEVTVNVGARQFDAEARRLSPEKAARALSTYAARHPKAFSWLAKAMIGESLPPTAEACAALAARIPLVALVSPPSTRAQSRENSAVDLVRVASSL
jgi:deazaflavin-dependent oxidoreductase (nitroreductase family)